MKTLKQKIAAAATVFAFATTAVIIAQPSFAHDHGGKHTEMKKLAKKLDLTSDQKKAIKELMKQGKDQHKAFREQREAFREQMEPLVKAEQFDEGAVRALFSQNQQNFVDATVFKANNKNAVWNLFTDEQQAKASDLPDPDVGPRKHMKMKEFKLLRKLDLSDEQKSEIRTVMQQRFMEIDPFDGDFAETAESIKALVQAETFDQAAAAAIFANAYQTNIDKMVSGLETRNQIWNILDDSQQAELEELRKAHIAKKESRKGRSRNS